MTVWDHSLGERGPANWAKSFPEAAGKAQSPIDIQTGEVQDLGDQLPQIEIAYAESADLKLFNDGHVVQADVVSGSFIQIAGVRYDLQQFHFHTPSSHLVDGQDHPVEMHIVHADAQGQNLVLAVFLQAGALHQELKKIFCQLPSVPSDRQAEPIPISGFALNELLPVDQMTYRYSGSLTMPPCCENVGWNVFAQPMDLSTSQIEAFQAVFSDKQAFPDGNRRPVQPLNGRVVQSDAGR